MIKITRIKDKTANILCSCCIKDKAEFILQIGRGSASKYLCADCIWELEDRIDETTFVNFEETIYDPNLKRENNKEKTDDNK